MVPTKRQVLDIHSHLLPPETFHLIRSRGEAVVVVEDSLHGYAVEFRGRTLHARLPADLVDAATHVSEMDRVGVDVHAVSLPPPMIFWADPELGLELSRTANHEYIDLADQYPDRFIPIASVPLQDPETATSELVSVRRQGFGAVLVGTSIDGVELDDPRLSGFFDEAEALDISLFVHALDPVGLDRMYDYRLDSTLGMVSEVALAASRMILGGVLDRYPGLQVCFSHFGGVLPYVVSRIEYLLNTWAGPTTKAGGSIESYLRHLWFDTCVHSSEALTYGVQMVGTARLMFGTDASSEHILGLVTRQFEGTTLEAVLHKNAERFLKVRDKAN